MIRFALLGCGRIGRIHADSIDVHPRAELAWVYDPIESAAHEVTKHYGPSVATAVDAPKLWLSNKVSSPVPVSPPRDPARSVATGGDRGVAETVLR